MSFNLFIPPQERAGTAPTPGPVAEPQQPAGRTKLHLRVCKHHFGRHGAPSFNTRAAKGSHP